MSGICDTVIVIAVPGGPEIGDIVTSGLPSVERSVVAHTELHSENRTNPAKTNNIFLNYSELNRYLIRIKCKLSVRSIHYITIQ